MYNYQILTKLSKTEIFERLVKMSLETIHFDKYEMIADVITFLFSEMEPEIEKYFFPEERSENVQFPKNERHE